MRVCIPTCVPMYSRPTDSLHFQNVRMFVRRQNSLSGMQNCSALDGFAPPNSVLDSTGGNAPDSRHHHRQLLDPPRYHFGE